MTRNMRIALVSIQLTAGIALAAFLNGCGTDPTKPDQPPATITPAKFCTDAATIDGAARSLVTSDAGKKDLGLAEGVLWPRAPDGTPVNQACNMNPLPASWDASISVPLGIAVAELIATEFKH